MFNKFRVSPYFLVLSSFAAIILIGAILLWMPFSNLSSEVSPLGINLASSVNPWDFQWGKRFLDSLFNSTSAVCVTGLTSYPNISIQYTLAGKIILMFLISLGGLGFVSIFTFVLTSLGGHLGFIDRYVIKEALGIDSIHGIIRFVRKMLLITFCFELIGALIYAIVFIPQFGVSQGILFSIFHAISAFNNAGFDILGSTSFQAFAANPIINLNTMFLIVFGGLGFPVIIELLSYRHFHHLSVYTKVVLLATATLILSGAVGLLLTEVGMSNMSVWQAFFTSVSARTAGFATTDMNSVSLAGRLLVILLMFIGASPLSTGGGIKTTTGFVVFLTIYSFIRGKSVHAFKRSLSNATIIKALSLTAIALVTTLFAFGIVDRLETGRPILAAYDSTAYLFECFSAFGTVGFSQGVTPWLSVGSKIVLILLMFFGRVGPMTAIAIFSDAMNKEENKHFQYIEENLPIG